MRRLRLCFDSCIIGGAPLSVTLALVEMHLALERIKAIDKLCQQCNQPFCQMTGAIFGDGQPLGFYVLALHGHSPEGRLAHLAMAVCTFEGVAALAVLALTVSEQDFRFRFLDWCDSPLNTDDFENKLDREAATQSRFRTTFLQTAEQVADGPHVSQYFSDDLPG